MSKPKDKKHYGAYKRSSGFVQRTFPPGHVLQISPEIPPDGQLSSWGVPDSVCFSFKSLGISSLYGWQEECVRKISRGLDSGTCCSAIYSAPTSGGKSLVADLLMFRRLFYEGRRALVVCPFVSICRERASFLRQVFSPLGIVVKEFHGPLSTGWNEGVDIAVCTVQKATSILHSFDSLFLSHLFGTVIVDEFHLAFSTSSMESFVTKLGLLRDREKILLIGMSATLPPGIEVDMLSWLNSHVPSCSTVTFSCDYRPIELELYVKRGSKLRGILKSEERTISKNIFPSDQDLFGSLCFEKEGVSTIVFCATRNWCEKAVSMLAKKDTLESIGRIEMVEALALLSPCGVHPVLRESIPKGIAFHHAGLTNEERAVIELGFRNGQIWLLCATSTISAGVNLPATRVILRTLSAASGGTPVTCVADVEAKLKQMVGRAGRTGFANNGEAIVMCQSDKEELIVQSVFSTTTLPSLPITLVEDPKQIAKEILEIIVYFKIPLMEYFLRIFQKRKFRSPNIHNAIQFLISSKLVAKLQDNKGESVLVPTVIGEALAYSAMSPDEAESTYSELSQARNRLCLAGGDLHLLYLVCPPISVSEYELNNFASSPVGIHSMQEAAILLGSTKNRGKVMVALILRDLITEYNLGQVAAKYGVSSGTVQYLQSNAAMYCAMVSAFCEKLQWTSLAAALNSVKPRLHFGVPAELVGLMDIEGISPARARALAAAGYKTIESIAEASTLDLAIALTRDVSVEGTQMTSNKTANRLMEITCKAIRQDALNKLAITTSTEKTFSEDTSDISILAPVSPPLIHQLMTQKEICDGLNISDIFSTESVSQILEKTRDELLGLFESPILPNRRISDMTTINAKRAKKSNEFGLPPNCTSESFYEEIEFNSSMLKVLDNHNGHNGSAN